MYQDNFGSLVIGGVGVLMVFVCILCFIGGLYWLADLKPRWYGWWITAAVLCAAGCYLVAHA